MEGWQIALLVKPLALIVFFAAVVIPAELVLRRYWPEGRVKRVLFDRTFRDTHPGKFMIVWLALMFVLIAWASWIGGAWGAERIQRSKAERATFMRTHPCPGNLRTKGSCPGYVIDHVRPICAGGRDHHSNMQWQTVADAKKKDRLEAQECRQMRNAAASGRAP